MNRDFRNSLFLLIFLCYGTQGFAAPDRSVSWLKLKGLQILRVVTMNNAILPEQRTEVITEAAIPRTAEDVAALQEYVLETVKSADKNDGIVVEYAPDSPLGLRTPPRNAKISQMGKIRQIIETARNRRGIMTIQRWVMNGAIVGGLLFLEGSPSAQITASSSLAVGFTLGMLSGAFTFFSKGYREWAQNTERSRTITEKVYGLFGKTPSRRTLERTGDFYSNYVKWGAFSEFPIDLIYVGMVKFLSRIFDGKTWDFLLMDAGFSALLGVQKQGTWEGGSRDYTLVDQVRREADLYRGTLDRPGLEASYHEIEDRYRLQLFGISFVSVATTSLNFLAISPAMNLLKTLGLVAPDASSRIDLISAGSQGLQAVLGLFQNPELTQRVIKALTLAPDLHLNVTLEILTMIAAGHALQAWNNFQKAKTFESFEREFGHAPVCAMTALDAPPPPMTKANF